MNAIISFFLRMPQPARIAIALLYVGCVAALSLLPMNDLPHIHKFRGFDKIVHFCMYFGLSGLLAWAGKTELRYARLILIVVATVGWGLFMEVMQMKMHLGRSFSWFDMIANISGVFSGIVGYMILVRMYVLK